MYNPYGMYYPMGVPYGTPMNYIPGQQPFGVYGTAQQQPYNPMQLCTPGQPGMMWPAGNPVQQPQNAPSQTSAPRQSVPVANAPKKEAVKAQPIRGQHKEKVTHALKVSDFTANDLTEELLDEIISKYGVEIDDIYNLAPGQEWMFSRARVVTSEFFTQALFRAIIKIKPSTFRQNVDKVCKKRDNLRTAFAYENMPKPYQVVLKNRTADLRFVDISDVPADKVDDTIKRLMAADRRRGFDLENDPLLRITIYKTVGEDTYAILISQPHINNDGASTGILLKELFVDYALESKGIPTEEIEKVSFQKYAEWLENLDRSKEFEYWKSVLKDLPELTKAPGHIPSNLEYDMQNKSLTFDPETSKNIRKSQGVYKATLNNIMQAAWGVILMRLYGVKDVTFGAITSGRGSEVENSDIITGGMVNAVPVRVSITKDCTFASLVKKVQEQFGRSLQYSHCSPQELQEAIGREEPIFDHLLNFHNFSGVENFSNAPNIPGITLLSSDSFDNLSTDLCVYFMMQKGAFVCNMTYNGNTFTDSAIEILMDCFKKVVEQIASNDVKLKISQIDCPDISVFEGARKAEDVKKQQLKSFIASLQTFEGLDSSAIDEIVEVAKVSSYITNDVIFDEKRKLDEIMFVMDGYVEIARSSKDGWMGTLMSLKPGKVLSVAGLFDDVDTYVAAQAISDTVKIVSVPKEFMWKLIERYPVVSLNVIKEVYATARAYSFLWLSGN